MKRIFIFLMLIIASNIVSGQSMKSLYKEKKKVDYREEWYNYIRKNNPETETFYGYEFNKAYGWVDTYYGLYMTEEKVFDFIKKLAEDLKIDNSSKGSIKEWYIYGEAIKEYFEMTDEEKDKNWETYKRIKKSYDSGFIIGNFNIVYYKSFECLKIDLNDRKDYYRW